jgi:trigger factor
MVKVQVGPTEDGATRLTVTGDAEQLEAVYQRVMRELRREVRVPGFRQGKAPEPLIAAVVGPERLRERLGQALVEETLTAALKGTPWVPLETPEADIRRCERGEPFEYQLSAPLAKVELTDVSQLQVKRLKAQVTPEMAAEQFEAQRERQARFRLSEHPYVQFGDTVNLSLRISHQGKVIDQYLPPRALRVDVGKDRLRLPLEGHLLGMGPDQEKVVLVTCPPDYPREEIRNQQVECYLKVLDILEKVLPDEDEFALTLGNYSSAEEARQGLQQNLQFYYDALAQREAEDQLMAQILEKSQVEIPESFWSERFEEELAELQAEAQEHREDRRPSEEELRQRAEERVRWELQREAVLRRVAIDYDIRPTPEDLAEDLATLAQANNVPLETLIERLSENQQIPAIAERTRLRLAMQKLLELAQVQDLPWTPGTPFQSSDADKDQESDAD